MHYKTYLAMYYALQCVLTNRTNASDLNTFLCGYVKKSSVVKSYHDCVGFQCSWILLLSGGHRRTNSLAGAR